MLNVVLADSELELVPKSIRDHPVIKKSAERRGKNPSEILLDSNFHHEAMTSLKQGKRRGRPDIVHISLLCALESPLNKDGEMRIFVHTRNNELIIIKPETRLPRAYNRFLGLIEKLFQVGGVPEDLELLRLENSSLEELIKRFDGSVYTLSREGRRVRLLEEVLSEDSVVIIGGFPRNDFISKTFGEMISISEAELTTWAVLNEVIAGYERI